MYMLLTYLPFGTGRIMLALLLPSLSLTFLIILCVLCCCSLLFVYCLLKLCLLQDTFLSCSFASNFSQFKTVFPS